MVTICATQSYCGYALISKQFIIITVRFHILFMHKSLQNCLSLVSLCYLFHWMSSIFSFFSLELTNSVETLSELQSSAGLHSIY